MRVPTFSVTDEPFTFRSLISATASPSASTAAMMLLGLSLAFILVVDWAQDEEPRLR